MNFSCIIARAPLKSRDIWSFFYQPCISDKTSGQASAKDSHLHNLHIMNTLVRRNKFLSTPQMRRAIDTIFLTPQMRRAIDGQTINEITSRISSNYWNEEYHLTSLLILFRNY